MKDFILQPIIELKNPLKILFWSCRLFKGVLRLRKMSRKISVMDFLLAICNSSNYSLQPYLACFYHSGKFLRKSVEWSSFLQKQTLTGSLQNSCSKEVFRKNPRRPASALKKNTTLDVLLERRQSMQKFSEQLFFQNNNGRVLLKVQIAFFENTNGRLWMDEKEIIEN